MKTTIKTAIIFSAFALLSTGAFAANNMKTDTTANDVSATVSYYDDTFGIDVNIDKATEGDKVVTIYDAAGEVILTDKFEAESASIKKSYLMTGIAEGSYTIEVKTGTEVVKHSIQLSAEEDDATSFAF
ncbi:hypothetical protein HQ865_03090 [Mucilaginibacter mali]|uniref:Secreted protein (Por secretion system target) n=1 Tax=Mucilaginibacter mali TaxID=2740462 RepID=A0A7D4Q6Q9_9SPHI|nr:hypothetical protein [Mucilaginibacter mali]QKJ28785.1 hypothetical protein HQ865_03090 [Mucilaginibacter mali]